MKKAEMPSREAAIRFLKGYTVHDLDRAYEKLGISFPCNDGRISRITVDRRRGESNGDC